MFYAKCLPSISQGTWLTGCGQVRQMCLKGRFIVIVRFASNHLCSGHLTSSDHLCLCRNMSSANSFRQYLTEAFIGQSVDREVDCRVENDQHEYYISPNVPDLVVVPAPHLLRNHPQNKFRHVAYDEHNDDHY